MFFAQRSHSAFSLLDNEPLTLVRDQPFNKEEVGSALSTWKSVDWLDETGEISNASRYLLRYLWLLVCLCVCVGVCRCVLGAKEPRWELDCPPECQDVTAQPAEQKAESDLQHLGERAGRGLRPRRPGLSPRRHS